MEGQHHEENDQLEAVQTEPTPLETAIPDNSPAAAFADNPQYQENVARYMEQLKTEENLPMGLLMGAAAAFVGALLWGVITVATGYQIGYMAIGVGLLVGFSVRFGGKGLSPIFGISGAVFALLGCVLGNLFSLIGFAANEAQVSITEILSILNASLIVDVMVESAQPLDFLFYGIAIYEGYRFSFRNVTDEELAHAGNG
ncbi:hypothetical protein BH09BAC1_BH09BAC1_02320 [soil metagenome]